MRLASSLFFWAVSPRKRRSFRVSAFPALAALVLARDRCGEATSAASSASNLRKVTYDDLGRFDQYLVGAGAYCSALTAADYAANRLMVRSMAAYVATMNAYTRDPRDARLPGPSFDPHLGVPMRVGRRPAGAARSSIPCLRR